MSTTAARAARTKRIIAKVAHDTCGDCQIPRGCAHCLYLRRFASKLLKELRRKP